jgi:dihydroorotase
MSDWLIRNARLVNEGREFDADLRVRGNRIDQIGAGLQARPGEQVMDAAGRWLLPGMVDDQVHFREPGLEHKGDLATESAAAVAGGITTVMEMPNTRPPTLDADALADKYRRAAGRCRTNFAFYLGGSNDNLEAIRRLDPKSAPGIKVFMGASTGNMLVDDPVVLEGIFREAPTPIITHCEDTPMIDANVAAARARHGDDLTVEMHPDLRSREACLKSSTLAVALARKHGTRLHVLHISTADELALFEAGPMIRADGSRKRITAETCVHFLRFDRADYATRGNFIKCNPAIKDASDREALLRALVDDRIDVLATDHAPHTLEEKQQPYLAAPSGLPLVQEALVAALECVHEGAFSVARVVHKFAHAPAQLFDVRERGFLREGYFADLVLVDPQSPYTVERANVLSKCGWSPFEGDTFRSRVVATWVNGELAWDGRRLVNAPAGQRVEFDR